jgi:hypothetical protein
MFFQILQGIAGVFLLMALWLAVQAYIRKRADISPDRDVLEDMTHGCGCCHNSEFCSGEKHEEPHGCGAPRPKGQVIQIASTRR